MGKFAPVQKPINQMTTPELCNWLEGLADTEILRSILLAEIAEIREGAEQERRTLRGLWYEIVKPVLSRVGQLNKQTSGGKPKDWPRKLSEELGKLVKEGLTSYEELSIIDGSRQRQTAKEITTSFVDVQMVGANFPWVILFIEKDTLWEEVQTLADLYSVSAISGHGEPSLACTENTVKEIIRSETFRREQPTEIILLSLTDYDPIGYKIAKDQFDQILTTANNITRGERGNLESVRHIRLGLTPDQLAPEEIEIKAYSPKKRYLKEWLKETGGIYGQPLGLELDALGLSRLRLLFAEGIEQHIDLERLKDDLRQAYVNLLALDVLMPDFEQKRAAMIKAVQNNEAWQEIKAQPIPDNLFKQAALEGAGWVAPVQAKELFSQADQLKAIMQGAQHDR